MKLAFIVLDQAIWGAIAAAGFGVLFNLGFRLLPWCAASGALALAVRTACLELGWNLEGASFAAALTVGAAAQCLRRRKGLSQDLLDVAGCIPMVPGSLAAKAIVGLYALTTNAVANESEILVSAAQYSLRVMFTTGAIGTGLVIPTYLLRGAGAAGARSE
jgi:uncharacterized membrane protein YjjB (DUF3815 family)